MSDQEFDSTNEASGFSGFGGHRLTHVFNEYEASPMAAMEEGTSEIAEILNSLGIEDAEQLVAIAAIPDVRDELVSTLGLKEKQFRALLEEVEGILPSELVASINTPAEKNLGLGVLTPTAEMIEAAEMSAAVETVEAVALPAAINLIPYMSPIRNQGPRGTCVAFALTALNEYVRRRRNILRDLSEQHLYYETKQIDGIPNACGTWQVKAVQALLNRGECREQVWPYNANTTCNNHGPRPTAARPDGLNNRLRTIQVPTRSVQAYKTHLSRQRPVTISVPVWNSWYYSAVARSSGRINMRIGNEGSPGGHAMCLVGYQDTPTSPGGGFFIVRNSWGPTWGATSPYPDGYGTMPYQYITDYAMEAFTADYLQNFPVSAQAEGEEDKDNDDGGEEVTTNEKVLIEVGQNIKITISD